jgi:hypothetical protein
MVLTIKMVRRSKIYAYTVKIIFSTVIVM